ncbi:MAG TPA: right-handed parallel beta-helix repeat-containing protein, partial [Anaerolineae bacterium]|nr:right-handed parallel beta-helix repeat-containing protein [Anaerolineae bacterium]
LNSTWLISLLLAITWLVICLAGLERQAVASRPHNAIWPHILSAGPISGNAYYVATSGDDNNPGTLSQPWRTVQKAANTLKPGEAVYVRGGVYNERVTINVSGSASGGYITFQNYRSERPILDGTGLTVPAADTAMMLITNQNYLIIHGFEIRNYKTATTGRVPVGIYVLGASHHLQIRHNRIHHIETNAPVDDDLLGADAHGIAVYGTSAPASINNLLIDSNELYNLKLGSSEALVLNGNVELFTVTNNLVHDNDNIGLDFIGYEGTAPDPTYDRARNGLVSGNTIFNIDSLTNPAYDGERSAGGIYVDGGTTIIVERNKVYSANIGIEIASEHQGRATSFITLRNNLIYNNHIAGIALGGYDTERGSTENCVIVNNTLFNNDTQEDGNGEILIQFDTQNNVIKNNIINANNSQSLLISNAYTQNTGNIVDYNLYFAPAGLNDSEWQWKNVIYQGFADYKAGSSNDAHSIFTNPKFVNPASFDLHLQAASPAINAGENLSGVGASDVDGEARVQGGTVDIGADERQ